MKEKIHTIPVIDALKTAGECAFCDMLAEIEEKNTAYILGPAYMEPSLRKKTDAQGFCGTHLKKMMEGQNKLGIALMLESHLITTAAELSKKKNGKAVLDFIKKTRRSCYVCSRTNDTFNEYMDTFFFLWKTEADIRAIVANGKGFCAGHTEALLETGAKKLSAKEYSVFQKIVSELYITNLNRLKDELNWFAKKHDYRYADEPWKNSADAIQRAAQKTT